MRILYFGKGATIHDHHFLESLVASGYETWFLRFGRAEGSPEHSPVPKGVHEVEWPGNGTTSPEPLGCVSFVPHFERVIERIRPDLVHAGPVQSCGFIAALADFHPFVVMSWGYDVLLDSDRNDLWRWVTRFTLKKSDMLLCDCDTVRRKVQDLVRYEDNRIVQFPWGVDLNRFAPGKTRLRLRHRKGWDRSFVMLSSRSWEPLYGIDTLLESFRRATTRSPRLRLLLVGSGSLEGEIRRFVDVHGLAGSVTIVGSVSHARMPDYFRASDGYISCSPTDGSSVSLLEAMASGLPVVVADTPSNREWVAPDQNGWLAPAGDADAFASMLVTASKTDRHGYERISQTNSGVARIRADWKRNFDLLLQAYATLMSKRGDS
jgi:glycosyltransferase involved in cell wall biosynthesis